MVPTQTPELLDRLAAVKNARKNPDTEPSEMPVSDDSEKSYQHRSDRDEKSNKIAKAFIIGQSVLISVLLMILGVILTAIIVVVAVIMFIWNICSSMQNGGFKQPQAAACQKPWS